MVLTFSPLIKICNGFGITLAQFFNMDDEYAMLTSEEKHFLNLWNDLTDENKQVAEKYISYLLSQQENK